MGTEPTKRGFEPARRGLEPGGRGSETAGMGHSPYGLLPIKREWVRHEGAEVVRKRCRISELPTQKDDRHAKRI